MQQAAKHHRRLPARALDGNGAANANLHNVDVERLKHGAHSVGSKATSEHICSYLKSCEQVPETGCNTHHNASAMNALEQSLRLPIAIHQKHQAEKHHRRIDALSSKILTGRFAEPYRTNILCDDAQENPFGHKSRTLLRTSALLLAWKKFVDVPGWQNC